ncbi:hypothetical protein ALPR1_03810 [Algoriphagus machipongonensis]|uniref:Outer membrane protein beta-barrel domain-containing protein n=1 Tax=Algoriphagus machipongonensis TaxID=388413 RepID=A3HW15_9BACT|nr:hypothetical protein ALPR1_03810 [Algoriphagus machipongonensis]
MLLLFYCGLVFTTYGQTESDLGKNNLTYDYSFYQGERAAGGEILSQGFVLGFSRYLTKKVYGDITLGFMNFEGRNSQFFLDPEEMSFLNMRILTIGGGYDIFQSREFILSGELAYLRQSNEMLLVNEPNYRETGISIDSSARLRLKSRFFITENLQGLISYSHGFGLSRYKSDWLSLGIGYSF